jgi:hypothetical protein
MNKAKRASHKRSRTFFAPTSLRRRSKGTAMASPKPVRNASFLLMRHLSKAHSQAGEEWIRERDIGLERG